MLSVANVSKLALQFVLVPILARLLGPGVYGLMGVAMSFVLLANMLSDGGMGAALVLEQDPDKELESTVFWIAVLIGSALALVLCALSWPIAVLYAQPALVPVLCALASILVLSAALSVPNAQIVRSQHFGLFAAGDLGCAAISAAVGIWLAYGGAGVWSLVAQQLVLWTTKTAWVFSVVGFWPRWILRLRLVRPLFHFSVGNLATGVADFAGKSIPVLIVGGLLGVQSAGHYSMAYQLTRVADMVVLNPVSIATFSSVAIAADRHAQASFVAAAWGILVFALAPFFVTLACTADTLAPFFLGPRWTATAPVLTALSTGAFLMCLYGFAVSALLGQGRAGGALKLTLITGVSLSLGTLAGVAGGVAWAAAGFSVAALLLAPLYLRELAQNLHIAVMRLIAVPAKGIVASIAMAGAMLAMRSETSTLPSLFKLLLVAIPGLAVFAMVAAVLSGQQILADLATLRRQRSRAAPPEPEAWAYLPPAIPTENP